MKSIIACYAQGKRDYPKALIAVDKDNALYFLHEDAELVAAVYPKKVDHVEGIPVCIVPKYEHNDLALALYHDKVLMVTVKVPSLFDQMAELIKPYNDAIRKQQGENRITLYYLKDGKGVISICTTADAVSQSLNQHRQHLEPKRGPATVLYKQVPENDWLLGKITLFNIEDYK